MNNGFYLIFIVAFLLSACGNNHQESESKTWQERIARLHLALTDMHIAGTNQNGMHLHQVNDLPVLPEDRHLDYTFPNTLCGNLVGRLLECEIERIRKQPRMSESEKLSVISYKRRTFARKRTQYLNHCQKTVEKLKESDIQSCMKLPCVEMDTCLQKISGQTGAK